MTSKTTNKFSPEVRDRAVRMALDHAGEHPSRWAAVTSIAAKIVAHRRRCMTGSRKPRSPCPLDHVNRQFKAPRPNVLWLSDLTHVTTWTGFVYIVLCDRRLCPQDRGLASLRAQRMPSSCSMRWSRPCMIDGRSIVAGSCTTATGAANTYPLSTPSAWLKQVSSRLSAASEIPMTMLSPEPSTVSTRLR